MIHSAEHGRTRLELACASALAQCAIRILARAISMLCRLANTPLKSPPPKKNGTVQPVLAEQRLTYSKLVSLPVEQSQ